MVELDAMLDDAREHFEEKFKVIRQKAADLGLDMETDIAVGHPVEQIVHRAETDHMDLIVLGRRGVSRFEKFIIGSTSEKVLRYAHCPVMVVR
jgi:nucleotide-binding universal stress UspA family protein